MKICVSTYSYGSYLRDEKLGIYGCIDHAAGEGFDGIEFVEGGWQDARQGDADGAERIKEHCERGGHYAGRLSRRRGLYKPGR